MKCKWRGGGEAQNPGEEVIGVAVFIRILILIIATDTFHELFHLFLALELGRPRFKALCVTS